MIGDGDQMRSMVYVDNLVDGVLRGRTGADTGGARLVGRRQPPVRGARDRRHGRTRARGRGLRRHAQSHTPAGDRRRGLPRWRTRSSSAAAATTSNCTCSARWARTSPATSRVARAELGYDPRGRARGGHATQHPLVSRARDRAVTTSLVTGGSGYFGSLLVRAPARPRRHGAGARHLGCRRSSRRRRVRAR